MEHPESRTIPTMRAQVMRSRPYMDTFQKGGGDRKPQTPARRKQVEMLFMAATR